MSDIALQSGVEVDLDGERLCAAGVVGRGVVTAIVDFVRERGEMRLQVGGLWFPEPGVPENVTWVSRSLEAGRHVSLRLVEGAAFDPPIRRSRVDRERDRAKKQEYRRHLQAKLKEHDVGAAAPPPLDPDAGPLALKVTLNGQRRCVAGHPQASVVGCHITCSVRDHAGAGQALDAELVAEARFAVQGLIAFEELEGEHLTWLEGGLRLGDVVTVEIVQTTEFDAPSRRERDDPAEEVRQAREFLGE